MITRQTFAKMDGFNEMPILAKRIDLTQQIGNCLLFRPKILVFIKNMSSIKYNATSSVVDPIQQPVYLAGTVKAEIPGPPEIFEQNPSLVGATLKSFVDNLSGKIYRLLPCPWRLPVEHIVKFIMHRMKHDIRHRKGMGKRQLITVTLHHCVAGSATVIHPDIVFRIEQPKQALVIVLPYLAEHHKKTQMNSSNQMRRNTTAIIAADRIEFKTVKTGFLKQS